MIKTVFIFICLCVFSLCTDMGWSYMGGGVVTQERTVGGKNPLKNRSIRRANPQTRLFHNSSCKHFKSQQSSIVFKSAQEAILSGFRPCSRCGG